MLSVFSKLFKSGVSTSPAKTLNVTDVKKIGRNALFAALAAGVAVLVNSVGHLDLGSYTAVVVPVLTIVLDTVYKWVKSNEVKEEE